MNYILFLKVVELGVRDTHQKKKIHLTNWAIVCRPKCSSGLGIKKSGDMNEVPLAKADWRIIQGDQGLWSRIYRRKYLKQHFSSSAKL